MLSTTTHEQNTHFHLKLLQSVDEGETAGKHDEHTEHIEHIEQEEIPNNPAPTLNKRRALLKKIVSTFKQSEVNFNPTELTVAVPERYIYMHSLLHIPFLSPTHLDPFQ